MPKRPHGESHYGQQQQQHQQQEQQQLQQPACKRQRSSNGSPQQLRCLPDLPPVVAQYQEAPFRHKSTHHVSRTVATNDVTYERLEFLGDAYLEIFASRLIYTRFQHLPAGQMSQLRELLVKNETLAEYGRAYGFDKRISAVSWEAMEKDARKGNKGSNKVIGDVFEAYVAAVVLSDDHDGYGTAENWVTALWGPKLIDAAKHDRIINPDQSGDPLQTYDPDAKAELQRRMGSREIKMQYEPYQESRELKGDKIGQNRHYIALYLTGRGYERRELGKGEGKNKVEAGNWAAIEAMHGPSKHIVVECEQKRIEEKKEWERRKEEEEKKARN